ncbi:unnamed protein product [Adineta ricciae]|uniref:Uncharacterized protein n=1 Tax=Adineta ricciae TaxID=249248 RepID=A0A815UA53_ADIRI|nr:unnamed protein product [Adineta ricciae]
MSSTTFHHCLRTTTQPNTRKIDFHRRSKYFTYINQRFSKKILPLATTVFKNCITNYLPSLQVLLISTDAALVFMPSIQNDTLSFSNPFSTEIQWFFEIGLYYKRFHSQAVAYTTSPYNQIIDEMVMNQCMKSFPNATKLTLKDELSKVSCDSISVTVNRILPSEQLQTSMLC